MNGVQTSRSLATKQALHGPPRYVDEKPVTSNHLDRRCAPRVVPRIVPERRIQIGPKTFLFVTALDADRALAPFAESFAARSSSSPIEIIEQLTPLYHKFAHSVFATLGNLSNGAQQFKVTVMPESQIHAELRQNARGHFTVSLNVGDQDWCDFNLELSRLQTTHGSKLEMTARPGAQQVWQQLIELRRKMAEQGVTKICLVDDHAFSCGTLERAVETLSSAGIEVEKIVTGTQVGASPALASKGIPLISSARFEHASKNDPRTILDSLDLVEARYFLLGATGGVVKLQDGSLGRVPYLLPFAEVSKKASIPENLAKEFSEKVLELNIRFFNELEQKLKIVARLEDSHPDVVTLLRSQGFAPGLSMADIACEAQQRYSEILSSGRRLSTNQNCVQRLNLPDECMFLDLNGTLIAPGESGIPGILERELINSIREVQKLGISVGLCSDSPLDPLMKLASKWGMHGPILAENGNYASSNGAEAVLLPMPVIDQVKGAIRTLAKKLNYQEREEMYAVDFCGDVSPFARTFAFGRGRKASVSCFSDSAFIEELRNLLPAKLLELSEKSELAFDFNPKAGPYGVAIIHPGNNVLCGKQRALNMLSDSGVRKLWMIGDGPADAVTGPDIESFLVGQGDAKTVPSSVTGVTQLPGVVGALEMMQEIVRRRTLP